MVDNFEQIRSILDFGGPDDSIGVTLLLRKKDRRTSFGNKNNSARTIKNYYFYTLEQFDQKEQEIKALCELLGCRAGVYLNKRNDRKMALQMLVHLSESIRSDQYKINGLLDTVRGKHYPTDKIQFIDCDSLEEYEMVKTILNDPGLRPFNKIKILAEVPTNSGFHVITCRFDQEYFKNKAKEIMPDFDFDQSLQKVNPVAIYYPSSNDNRIKEDNI